jgi:DNA repair exonuclease SbcCD ATPase subunit
MERRLHHMEIAIENLHAAGLHDVAQRLEQQLRHHLEQMEPRARARGVEPAIDRLGEELRRVRAELEELRANLHELRQHIGELHRDREGR